MRFIIDTKLQRIIVPDTFYHEIDKQNELLKAHGVEKPIDYVEYVNSEIAKAQQNSLIRKSDVNKIKNER